MDAFYEQLMARAVTIDELLSDAYEQLPGQKSHSELAARRLAEWCRSSASGDWPLFARRLERDGLSLVDVLARFATVRRNPSAPTPAWFDDAVWIAEALQGDPNTVANNAGPCAFEELLAPVVREAETRLWADVDAVARSHFGGRGRACLQRSLLAELSKLTAPALYERFTKARKDSAEVSPDRSTVLYDQFVASTKSHGFRQLFDEKPVLLRLMASITRQWIETSRELATRLDADLSAIHRELPVATTCGRVISIDGGLSDPHNLGRSVAVLGFEDGSRVVYKPKDMRADAAWRALIERLNCSAPLELRTVRVLPRAGYGWTEFIDHASCPDSQSFRRFFQRAGAWLALFHCFVGVDMHQDNIIAAGEDPVPIDLEMILQAAEARRAPESAHDAAGEAFEAATETVLNSVLTVGLLPAYGRYSAGKVFSVGGVTSNSAPRATLTWTGVNSDAMRPRRAAATGTTIPNLPHVGDGYGRLGDYIDDFTRGFDVYAAFLQRQRPADLLDGFAGLTIRKVLRPTRYYYMLLGRLRDHRAMDDGIVWSAQADFGARLADWEHDSDTTWVLQRAERAAVVELNVPHFVMPTDGREIRDATSISIQVDGSSGLDRASDRLLGLSDQEVAWQAEVIRQNTGTLRRPTATAFVGGPAGSSPPPSREVFAAEADAVAHTLSRNAIRKGPGAAWIGLDWLGDSEVSQLVVVGPDLYNGACGIALFFAAHAAVERAESSRALALAALARPRQLLHGRNPARTARSLGLGGGLGLGSMVYALAVISALLKHDGVLCDAHAATELITDDVIAADRQLDVLGGSAGAILGLLRLYRQSGSDDALRRAADCGRHLMAHPRVGPEGCRSWTVPGFTGPINGMSHGAAGFAYALAALASATGSEEFASAATECVAFENATFDAKRGNWADLRGGARAGWPCKWCHGAPGIGLARAAMARLGVLDSELVRADVHHALGGVERGWPAPTDTLCCGTLGSVEFLWEAGEALSRKDLQERASRRLLTVIDSARSIGDYRWSNGNSRYNLGLFRGVAGVGYTALRRVDTSVPNVAIWE